MYALCVNSIWLVFDIAGAILLFILGFPENISRADLNFLALEQTNEAEKEKAKLYDQGESRTQLADIEIINKQLDVTPQPPNHHVTLIDQHDKQIRGQVVYVQPKEERWNEDSSVVHIVTSDWLDPSAYPGIYTTPTQTVSGIYSVHGYISEDDQWRFMGTFDRVRFDPTRARDRTGRAPRRVSACSGYLTRCLCLAAFTRVKSLTIGVERS